MSSYPFLSPEWFAEVRRIHTEHPDAMPREAEIRMNLRVTGSPLGDNQELHMIIEAGQVSWDDGHLEDPDVSLILGYEVAREIFVGGNPQAAMEAFMAGKITMSGDITKLMIVQAVPGPGAPALAAALLAITD